MFTCMVHVCHYFIHVSINAERFAINVRRHSSLFYRFFFHYRTHRSYENVSRLKETTFISASLTYQKEEDSYTGK